MRRSVCKRRAGAAALSWLVVMLTVAVFVAGAVAATGESALRISLDVKDMNILDVLRLVATQGQVNIVASRTVQGRVTAKLDNVTIAEALRAILETNSLVFKEEQGIYKVFSPQDIMQQQQTEMTYTRLFVLKHAKITPELRQMFNAIKSPRGRLEINAMTNQIVVNDTQEILSAIDDMIATLDTPLETYIINLKYAKAAELHAKLTEILPREAGEVFVDERTNSLVIRAIAKTLDMIQPLVDNWDRRSRQVLIEAKIFELSGEHSRGLGVSWEYQEQGKNAVSIGSAFPLGVTTGGILKIGTLSQDEYAVTVQALESLSNSNILSNPRIVVTDNKEANILVGSSEPYQVVFIDNETKTQSQETRFIDVGVKLMVTPQISDDDFITLKIRPEVSSARRVAEVNNALAVDTTQVDTTVVIRDGRTIVLGGLMKETDQETEARIPVLGSLPVLGRLFRSTLTGKIKKEIVVLITPHILREEDSASAVWHTEREAALLRALEQARNKKTGSLLEEREYQ